MNRGHAEPSDEELATRARAGDAAAFRAIVIRHKASLHRLVARLTGDEEEALDLVQEAFVAAHGALARYDPARPFRVWLTRIAVNKARDWRRRRLVRRWIAAALPHEATEPADDAPALDDAAADRAELKRVEAAIARLPATLREVLVLRTIEGLDQARTAEVLGVSGKAVETRLYRARRRLTAELSG